MTSGFISVDDHVQEPPDLWTSRLSKDKWGDRIPHLEKNKDGGEHWVADDEILLGGSVAQAGALMEDRNDEPGSWDDVPAEAYDPKARLKAMDTAGADYAVLYPTVAGMAGEAFGGIKDPELQLACVQAYNDWLIEEWAAASERFIPQCIVPISSPEATVAEIRRAVAKGHRGVIFPALPMDLADVPHVADPEYDPVWAACEELSVPLCLHAGASHTLKYDPYLDLAPNLAKALNAVARPVSSVYVLGLFLFSRILLRHPGLKVVLAESALSWGLCYLEWADHQADHDGLANEGYDLTPSEMFHRQCYLTAWYDKVAPFAPYIHTENILWSSNFPLATSTWPTTQKSIGDCLEGLTEEQCEQVVWKNAASLYGL
jgi:predicted TIM-barrel fold metal-dependent hydrolase